LAEAKERRLEAERLRVEKARKREEAQRKKSIAEEDQLRSAKTIIVKYRANRIMCDRDLSCHDLVLLLRDMGFNDEAHSRDGKRLLQKDLRELFWHKYTANPFELPEPNTTDEHGSDVTEDNPVDPDGPDAGEEWDEDASIPAWDCSDEEPNRE